MRLRTNIVGTLLLITIVNCQSKRLYKHINEVFPSLVRENNNSSYYKEIRNKFLEEFNLPKIDIDASNIWTPHQSAYAWQPLTYQMYLPFKEYSSEVCALDVNAIIPASRNGRSLVPDEAFATQVIDSWGKASDGFIFGNWNLRGFFDECMDVYAKADPKGQRNESFTGQYCKMTYVPYVSEDEHRRMNLTALEVMHMATQNYRKLKQLHQSRIFFPFPGFYANVNPEQSLQYATCMPSSCTAEELWMSVNSFLLETGHLLIGADCQNVDDKPKIGPSETFGIIAFSFLGLILIGSTCYGLYCDSTEKKITTGDRVILAFSVIKNAKKIFHIDANKSSGQITCVHGIRAFSVIWVIYGHEVMFALGSMTNIMYLEEITKPVLAQVLINAQVSVDTFFMIGGIFTTLGLLNRLKKTRRFDVVFFYFHRIIRLMPAVGITCLFVACISTMMVHGPNKNEYINSIKQGCRKTWYLDLFFASNLVVGERMKYISDDPEFAYTTCIGQSWYMSCDMQIYLILPIIILPLFYRRQLGKILLVIWTVASILIRFILIWAKDLAGTELFADEPDNNSFVVFYTPPWTRICAVLVGVWVGYILYQNQGKQVKLSMTQVALGWTACLVTVVLVLFGPYDYDIIPATPMPLSTTLLYSSTFRAAWAASVGWIVIACHWGYGGFVDWVLSSPVFQPLSRLSFTLFLIALPLQNIVMSNNKVGFYGTHYVFIEKTIGVVVYSLAFALILSLIAEGPIMNLEKILLGGGPRKRPMENKILIQEEEKEKVEENAESIDNIIVEKRH